MKAGELLGFAAGALRGHGLRSSLSLTGVAVGVASVILLTSLAEGARRYIAGEFETLGSDLIVVIPGRTETTGAAPLLISGLPHDLTIEDAKAIQRQLRRVRTVAPLSMGTAAVSWQSKSRDIPVIGTTAEFLPLRRLELASGLSYRKATGTVAIVWR